MKGEHLSHLDLDALRIGAVASDRADTMRIHLAECERCAHVEADLEKSASEFRQRFDPAALATETIATFEGRRRFPWWRRVGPSVGFGQTLRMAALPVAAVASAGIALFLFVVPERSREASDGLRAKGFAEAGCPDPAL
jgi:hypothetical protein